MLPEVYYLRLRGRVTGPFDLAELRKLARRGKLTRVHEVSADQRIWVSASEVSHLFSPTPPLQGAAGQAGPTTFSCVDAPAAPSNQTDAQAERLSDASATTFSPSDSGGGLCYYSQGGETRGPLPLQELESLAARGVLRPDDPVWRSGDLFASPARQLPELLAAYATQSLSVQKAGGGIARRAAPTFKPMHKLYLASGLSAALVLLVCAHVPFDKTPSGLTWWWDLFGRSGAQWQIVLSVFMLCSGVGLLWAALLLRGSSRARVYLAVSVLGYGLLVASVVYASPSRLAGTAGMLVPVTGTALIVLSVFRLRRPWDPRGKTGQAVAGVLVLVSMFVAIVAGAADFGGLGSAEQPTSTWGSLVVVLALGALLSCLTGGILGLVSSQRESSRSLNGSTIGAVLATMAMAAAACLIVTHGIVEMLPGELPGRRLLFVNVLRLLVVAGTLLGLLTLGLFDALSGGRSPVSRTQTSLPV